MDYLTTLKECEIILVFGERYKYIECRVLSCYLELFLGSGSYENH
jgi:hypothetical protein